MKLRFASYLFLLGMVTDITAQTDSIRPEPEAAAPLRWRLGLQSGAGYLWANASPTRDKLIGQGADAGDVDKYRRQFRMTYIFAAEACRLFGNTWGVGIKYALTANIAEQLIRFDTGDGLHWLNINITGREYVNYVGASFLIRRQFARACHLEAGMSAGYARYRNEFETGFSNSIFKTNMLETGNSVGGSWDASLEYFPTSGVSMIIGAGYFMARFDRLSVRNGHVRSSVSLSGDERKNVRYFDLHVGFKIYLK